MSKQITRTSLRKEVMEHRGLSLLQFRTEWSGACQIISPAYEELSKSYTGMAGFFSIDVEQEAGVEKEFGVQEFPTILFFRNGELVDHAIGLIPKNTLIAKIEQALISGGQPSDTKLPGTLPADLPSVHTLTDR
jgi:thioredoxin 1